MQLPWKLLEVVAVLRRKQRSPQESQTTESAFIQGASDQADKKGLSFLVLSEVVFLFLVAFLKERRVYFLGSSEHHLFCFLPHFAPFPCNFWFSEWSVLLQMWARRNVLAVLWSFPTHLVF